MTTQSNQRPTITPQELIDELIYASYVHNRSRSPHISPLAWAKVLPNVPAMEARYLVEKVGLVYLTNPSPKGSDCA